MPSLYAVMEEDRMERQYRREQIAKKNKELKEDLEHCANQFTDDGKNVLLSLR